MDELHEAARKLLEQLEQGWVQRGDVVEIALRQALAQSEQDPTNKMPTKIFAPNLEQILNAAGFYKRERVLLTDDEIGDVHVKWNNTDGASFADFARLIRAKLKEKNEQS